MRAKPDEPSLRQKQVLRGTAIGFTNREIAYELGIELSTVKTHIENLMNLARANNRTHLVVIGLQKGWINLDELNISG